MFKTPEQLFGLVMSNPNQIKREQQLVSDAFIGLSTELIALKKENNNLRYFSSKISESQEDLLHIDTLDINMENIKEFDDFFNKYKPNLENLINFLLKNTAKLNKTATIGPEPFNIFQNKIDKIKDPDVFIGKSDSSLAKTPGDFYEIDFETKRGLNQQSTDLVSNKFLVNKSKYLHFIISAFNLLIDTIKTIPEIEDNFDTIDFIMKGGNLLKLLFEKMSKDLNSQINDYLQTKFGKNFSSSDFDFDFKFKPNKNIDQTVYDNQRVIVSNLITIYIISLRDILFTNKDYFFDFYNLNQKAQEKIVKEVIEKYNESIKNIVQKDKNNNKETGSAIQYPELDGAEIISLIYDYDQSKKSYISYTKPGEGTISTNFIKNDYCIIGKTDVGIRQIPDPNFYLISYDNYLKRLGIDINVPELADIKNSINNDHTNFYYNTTNINISFNQARFSLFRIKVNFIGKIKLADGKFKLIQIPGELLDISIAKKNDYKLLSSKPEFYTKFLIKNINKVITVQSHEGLINEITLIIFDETNYQPWSDIKYDKRLIRLLLLLTLKLLYNNNDIPFIDKINFCEKFLLSVNNDFSDLNLNANEYNIFNNNFSLFYISLKQTGKNKLDPKYKIFIDTFNDIFKKMINVLKVHYNMTLKKGNIHKITYLDGFQ